jgi:single-strand DNA-binding protein
MASYNKVLLMGNLTREIELRSVAGGQSVARIGLAVNRNYTTQSGERREEVTFVDCEAWGKTGETMAKYLTKGRPVFIEGRLKLDQWEDKEGNKRSALRIVVEGFQFIDSRAGGGGGGGGGGGQSARDDGGGGGGGGDWQSKAPSGGGGSDQGMSGDDIPF